MSEAKRTYVVETYGCQMNVHDSERIAGLLEADGYVPAATPETADVVVVNTCSVRERAEEKLFTRLGEIRAAAAETGHRPLVAVAGCVAQQEGAQILKRSKLVDVVVGTQAVKQLPSLVARAAEGSRAPLIDVHPHEDVSFPFGLTRRDDPVRAYVTVIEGCNEFCSFCVVPYTRGHERMRPVAEILAEARHAAATGHREVQLLGQIVNHYQAPDRPGVDFAALLELVHEIEGLDRIRFASPHPRHFARRTIDAIRDLPKVCKHLHMPVQSGSTPILTQMRRRYSREQYLELVAAIRETIPGVALSTDMIVGFPGETDAHFDDTMSMASTVRFHSMYTFKYSPRPRTLSGQRYVDDVPEPEKTRRIVALQQLQRTIQGEIFDGMVGQFYDVLIDGPSRRRPNEWAGRTDGNTIVNIAWPEDAERPSNPLGHMVRARVTEAGPNTLKGVPC
ncbi:MAG: tRNA (N6-isopentenyl adenosine(37)-C2)-methylthiotransferase MiaB [Vicinamibacteraceae bacterium]